MNRRREIRSQAYEDLLEIFDYLADRNPTAAINFRAACLELADGLVDMPGRGPIESTNKSGALRRVIVPGFGSYLLFYYVTSDAIIVARVMHSSRDIAARLKETGDR